jgi:hypothetical protein
MFADSVLPAEALYFYLAVVALLAGICIAGFVVGLKLNHGPRYQKFGLGLAVMCAMMFVSLVAFVAYAYTH